METIQEFEKFLQVKYILLTFEIIKKPVYVTFDCICICLIWTVVVSFVSILSVQLTLTRDKRFIATYLTWLSYTKSKEEESTQFKTNLYITQSYILHNHFHISLLIVCVFNLASAAMETIQGKYLQVII